MFCPRCGAHNDDARTTCVMCDAPLTPVPGAVEEVGAVGRMIPTGNPAALTAYYLGIFALVPFLGALLGPLALVLGIKGLKAAPRVPGQVGKVHARIGLVLGILTTLANWGVMVMMCGLGMRRN
ncbi:MAG TPA: hypothetical protein VFV75_12725 [Candidatus Polarisedimenticolaceae bacterium]|nr:hypothetical protein [Candidatus Polarisedimenticolaceae bacterium]